MKIRMIILLIIALVLTGFLVLFPNVADQTLHLEAFGWVFEMQQGLFVIFFMVFAIALSLLKRLLFAILSGPGQLWQTLRMGSEKRREHRLREGLAEWIDQRGDMGAKSFRSSKGILPDWSVELLNQTVLSARDIMPDLQDDPLVTALRARLATEPGVATDLALQKQHLHAWLSVHPESPLAMNRLTAIAEQEGEWTELVRLLESNWTSGRNSAAMTKKRLAKAYIHLALEKPDEAVIYLQKAERFDIDDEDLVYGLGKVRLAAGDQQRVRNDWLAFLDKGNSWLIAEAIFPLLKVDALQYFQVIEKKKNSNAAMRWLQARLAHAAKLQGLANDLLDQLLEQEPRSTRLLQTKAQWYADSMEWKKAFEIIERTLG